MVHTNQQVNVNIEIIDVRHRTSFNINNKIKYIFMITISKLKPKRSEKYDLNCFFILTKKESILKCFERYT